MATRQDVESSLGFLALKARDAHEQQQAANAFAREQAAREDSEASFARMTQLLNILDQRRAAKQAADMEIAQLAGTAGVPLTEEATDEAKGRFAIGEALSAADRRKQEEERKSREAMQRLISERWGSRDAARGEELEKKLAEKGVSREDIQAHQKERDAARAAEAKALEDARQKNRKELKAIPAAKAGSGAGAEAHPPGYKLTNKDLERLHKAQESDGLQYNQFKQVTDADIAQVGSTMKTLGRKWDSFTERLFGGDTLSDQEIADLTAGDRATAKLLRIFNVLGKERSGASFTSNEVKRLMLELPGVADSPTRLKAKLEEIKQALRNDMLYRDQLIREGRIPDMQKKFKLEDVAKELTPEEIRAELERRKAASGGPK